MIGIMVLERTDLWKTRINLLSAEESATMESFVERKVSETKERHIVDWDPADAKQRYLELLFD